MHGVSTWPNDVTRDKWRELLKRHAWNLYRDAMHGNLYRDAMHGVCTEFKIIQMTATRFNHKYRIPSARWADWDYGNEGAYFVTICTRHREHYFGEIVDGEMHYSELGMIAVQEWLKSAELRPDMQLDMDCFQVMPNHIHGIVIIGRDGRDAMHCVSMDNGKTMIHGADGRDAKHGVSTNNTGTRDLAFRDAMHCVSTGNRFGPQSKNLASVMRGFKSAVTTRARTLKIPFGWQTRFHDRVIRDDEEFRRIAAYIEQNPLDREDDSLNAQNDK